MSDACYWGGRGDGRAKREGLPHNAAGETPAAAHASCHHGKAIAMEWYVDYCVSGIVVGDDEMNIPLPTTAAYAPCSTPAHARNAALLQIVSACHLPLIFPNIYRHQILYYRFVGSISNGTFCCADVAPPTPNTLPRATTSVDEQLLPPHLRIHTLPHAPCIPHTSHCCLPPTASPWILPYYDGTLTHLRDVHGVFFCSFVVASSILKRRSNW